MRTQVRSLMKGGVGDVTVLHFVETDDLPNVRFVGEMTLPPGASIGVVFDGGDDHRVGRGDIIVTGGASH